jgi:hypothetical protein
LSDEYSEYLRFMTTLLIFKEWRMKGRDYIA